MTKHSFLSIGAILLLCSCGGGVSPSSTDSTGASSTSVSVTHISETSESSTSEATTSSTASSSQEEVRLDPMAEPLIGRQYYLNHIGDIFTVWESYRGKGITIAVIDVGFEPDHEDFTYADGTSKVSPLSADFKTTGTNTTVTVGKEHVLNSAEAHGTFCAGVAAAGLNGKGVVGIAPEAELLLLKTDAKPRSIAKAFRYAADNGARVVTISIGSYYDYGGDLVNDGSDLGTVFDAPVKYCYDKGVAVISAGGNGGLDGKPTEFTFPGCVDNVIGVGGLAANSSTEIWEGSSYNSSPKYQSIDVFAPSERMFGCCNGYGKTYDGGEWRGTSFASPIVAGMAALYFEANPTKGAADFEQALYASCHKITTSDIATSRQLGYGRVDVGALLNLKVSGSIEAKVKTTWSSCYAYVWNSVSGKAQKDWPGIALTKTNGSYSVTLNASSYDSVIFTAGEKGPQTADLMISSFASGKTYDLAGAVTEGTWLVGKYA